MIDPHIRRVLDGNGVLERRGDILMHRVADDNIRSVDDREADTLDSCVGQYQAIQYHSCQVRERDYALPPRPIMDLFDPTKIFFAPEMVPDTTTMRGSAPATALSSASSVDTVTVSPPLPPEVLCRRQSVTVPLLGGRQTRRSASHSPQSRHLLLKPQSRGRGVLPARGGRGVCAW